MGAEAALQLAEKLLLTATGKPLNDLQRVILAEAWRGHRYGEIALRYGCTEGHVKDVASQLWRSLSLALGERVAKNSLRAALARRLEVERLPLALQLPLPENPNFVGRLAAIAAIDRLLAQGHKVIVIQGEGGIGKTTLAQHYLQLRGFDQVLELMMAKEPPDILPVERVVEEWLRQDLNEEPGREFGVTLGRLKRHLQTRRIGLLIDNLEPALDSHGKLIYSQRRYLELLRVLADWRVQSVTLMTSRDRLCEPALAVEHYRLPGLSVEAWQQFFSAHQIFIDSNLLQEVHSAYGGNAKAMGLLCGEIRADFDGDAAAYWQEYQSQPLGVTTLGNLVMTQVNRLAQLDAIAYRLFCRLGCYRYQAVAQVPSTALAALLWDVDPTQHAQVMAALRNRSLVEYHAGHYWLHPVVRAEAIARLRQSPDWELANRRAAKFWSASVERITTLPTALQALEAYYHNIAIANFEAAAAVLLQSRDNQWGQYLPLASSLYRMGLIQPVIEAITLSLEKIQDPQQIGELHNILGDVFWITGQIHQAIRAQEQTIHLARQHLAQLRSEPDDARRHYYFRMLEVDALLSIGLYQLDLGELEQATQQFSQVITLAQGSKHQAWAEKAYVCLALTQAHLGQFQLAQQLAEQGYQALLSEAATASPGRYAYFIQRLGQTYSLLRQSTKAQKLYQKAIVFAEESHYIQIKANALSGLAALYRCAQQPQPAIAYHQQAIALLAKLGAKCDLAEAYYQFGLTYQQFAKANLSADFTQQATHYLNQAIALFGEIQAPRQVKKIEQVLLP
ncbi:NB-ARC domain-containing protein [Almyronema epifaneia]|uniref:NB-ARC domain-containing protein n=1 Tax=Almyronema epifaneia S1 TaxID=2991925 RepID=A0ABW6IDX8_9CYAN